VQAEAAAHRAETAAAEAEKAADESVAMSTRVQQAAARAEDSADHANDVVTRLCWAPQPAVSLMDPEAARRLRRFEEDVRSRCGPGIK